MLIAGVDIIEIARVQRVYERYGERFLRRIYTCREIAYCRGRAPQLASRFAAKEATMKALGTGVRGIRWRDIEIVRGRGQAPRIELHGTAEARAERLGLSQIALSLSHSKDFCGGVRWSETASTAISCIGMLATEYSEVTNAVRIDLHIRQDARP